MHDGGPHALRGGQRRRAGGLRREVGHDDEELVAALAGERVRFAHVAPHSAAALSPARATGVPLVHFGVGTGELLAAMRGIGVDALGVDWRIPLDEAARRVGSDITLQGNIDPALLAAPWPVLQAHIEDVLERGTAARAHVLNLGHGVPPDTDPAVLTRIVEFVHERA